MVMQLFQKSFSRDHWPAVAFTADETSALHLVTNAVNVYDPHNFSQGAWRSRGLRLCFSSSISLLLPSTTILHQQAVAALQLPNECGIAASLHASMHALILPNSAQTGVSHDNINNLSSTMQMLDGQMCLAAGVAKKLAVKGLAGFAVSPNTAKPLLAAYVPEGKSAPGFVGIWDLNQLSKGDSPAPIARRSFFRVRNSTLMPHASDLNSAGFFLCIAQVPDSCTWCFMTGQRSAASVECQGDCPAGADVLGHRCHEPELLWRAET